MSNRRNQENKVDLVRMSYFVGRMEEVEATDAAVVETTNPSSHLIDLARLLRSAVVDGIENSNANLAHVVGELISMNED